MIAKEKPVKKAPNIAESEWIVMKVLWEKAPRTGNEIVQALDGQVSWSPRTIKTLLNRLVKKGALGFTKQGRAYLYHPLVEEAECFRAKRDSFLQRIYGGAFTPMLAQFIEDGELSPEEIQELKNLLDKKRG